MKKLSLFTILCMILFPVLSQRIENVRFEQSGNMINIYYDLFESESGQRFEVKAYFSLDKGKTWTGPLNQVNGNVGINQTGSLNKKIIWDVLWEIDSLVGDVLFEVRAMPATVSNTRPANGGGATLTFTDSRDGKTYRYITIGNQVWMAENLAYLPFVNPPSAGSETNPCCYVYDYNGTNANQMKDNAKYTTYGVLYNWPAAMDFTGSSDKNPSGVQGICPPGWHLPSDTEWKELEIFLGMGQAAVDGTGFRGAGEGGKLKETGNAHWKKTNIGATNSSSYTALPGGIRIVDGWFKSIGKYVYFWSSTEYGGGNAWVRGLRYNSTGVSRGGSTKDYGFSVRCLRDPVE